jgi:hypothetical protein
MDMTGNMFGHDNFLIDFERHGNVVRFYFGNNHDYTGDDWNDLWYENNAGRVYKEYINGYIDVAFSLDWHVYEPGDSDTVNAWAKNDMKDEMVPCISIVPAEKDSWHEDFIHAVFNFKSINIYFNMPYDVLDCIIDEHHGFTVIGGSIV